jgi:predicted regulator of Ras-like GTPase activity (Roadblock/LC7/MglB family)
MTDALAAALSRVSHVPGVRGALVVDAEAGVPVVAEVAADTSGEAVAALAAALYRRTMQAAGAGGFGALQSLHLEAEGGHVFVAGSGDLIVVVLADSDAQLGMVRLETARAAEALQ